MRALVLALAILLLSTAAQAQDRYPAKRWMHYAEPEVAGWSAPALDAARAFADSIGTAAFVLVHQGAIVASHGDVRRRYMAHSVRKSLLSALYGTYVGDDAIDLDATLAELGIDDREGLTPAEREATVRHLLQARSGVYHPSAYFGAGAIAGLPARGSHAAGTHWHYNNWDFNALATILRQQTDADLFEAFGARIAAPIGMEHYRPRDGYLHYERELSDHAAYPFRLSALDLARFGLLFEREGRWKGEQVIPAEWVAESTRSYSDTDGSERGTNGYGYMWWTLDAPFDTLGGYAALGVGTQVVAVLPALDIVFVHRVDTFEGDYVTDYWALLQRLLDARVGPPAASPALVSLAEPAATEAPAASADMARFAGTYTYPDGGEITISVQDGVLVRTDAAWGSFGLMPRGGTAFEIEDVQRLAYFEPGRTPGTWDYVEEGRLLEVGDALLDADRSGEAVDVYERLVRHYPRSARAHLGLGNARLAMADTAAARESFRRAAGLDASNLDAARLLAETGPAVDVGPARRQALAGTYRLDNFTLLVSIDDGRLMVTPPWGGTVALVAAAHDTFFLEGAPVRLSFLERDGEVAAVEAALGTGDNLRLLPRID